jgi:hypothetical protein
MDLRREDIRPVDRSRMARTVSGGTAGTSEAQHVFAPQLPQPIGETYVYTPRRQSSQRAKAAKPFLEDAAQSPVYHPRPIFLFGRHVLASCIGP